MCGIAGIFKINGESVTHVEIKSMTESLAHRGPDGGDIFIDENLALGHRRLSILDLSSNGSQPMISQNGEWVLIFNGCIYNYKSLQNDLKSKGHQFKSTSDTEVIVEGIAEYGVAFFEKLDGMFAIAAWNTKERKLWISRDRYGVKPLYYWFQNGHFIFASEIKAFLKYQKFKVEVDKGSLNEYFTFQNQFSFRTLFKNVFMLPPANTIPIDSSTSQIKHKSWWDYNFSEPDEKISFNDAKEETVRLIERAVAKQMIADVPVGSYLSGGMDSGSISVLASKHVNRLFTFTAGFEMSEVNGVEVGYDERIDAELTANFIKSEHYEQVINAGDLRWSLPRVIWHLEDLKVGMSYPNYYISRLASKFVKVCLQGTGGDELYGGYPWRYYRIFKSIDRESFFNQYYSFWQRLVNDNDKSKLFQPGIIDGLNLNEPRSIFEKVFTFNESLKYDNPEQHIQNSLYFEIKTFLPGLLMVGDKLSMANGLEERFPFLDNDLVDFAQKIPVKHKLGNLTQMKLINENEIGNKVNKYFQFDDGKNVLRKSMENILPSKILDRPKQGFSAPDESWYRGENAKYVKDLLLGKNVACHEFIQPSFIKETIHRHCDLRENKRLLLWSLMSFEWWCRLYLNKTHNFDEE